MYTLIEDYVERYEDGTGRYKTIAKAGQAVLWETAYAWGLVKTKHEPKTEEKTEPKAKPEKA